MPAHTASTHASKKNHINHWWNARQNKFCKRFKDRRPGERSWKSERNEWRFGDTQQFVLATSCWTGSKFDRAGDGCPCFAINQWFLTRGGRHEIPRGTRALTRPTQARNQLGTPGGAKSFLNVQHLSRGSKKFCSASPGYSPGLQHGKFDQ